MIRRGRWKFIHYVGFEPELFDLQDDPEEITNLAQDTAHAAVVVELDGILRSICDPEAMDAQAHQDQADLVESLGGREAAFNLGSRGETPPPELPAT